MESTAKDTVSIEKIFNAPAKEIWRAWTEPAIIKRWFGSDANGTGLSAMLDVKPGGHFEISFANSDGERHTCFGIYTQVKPFSILSFTWEWKNEPGVQSFVTVELQGQGNTTIMHFKHADVGFASAHNYLQGWNDTFVKLERLIDTEQQAVDTGTGK